MPNINIPVSQELLDRLTAHAFHAKATKADVVRDLIASLSGEGSTTNAANTANTANTTNTTNTAKRVGFDTASSGTNELLEQKKARALAELQQWQAQPVAIEPEPVAIKPEPSLVREPSAFALKLKEAAEAAKAIDS